MINFKNRIKMQKADFNYKGQASIEFVLILPLLIVTILTISQFGYYIYCKNVLNHAAREAARVLATTNSENLAYLYAKKNCGNLNLENLNIAIMPTAGNDRSIGEFAGVTLTNEFEGIGNYLKKIIGYKIYIQSTCNMRMECRN